MRLDEVEELARRLMDQHGLDSWELRFDGAKARAGICRFDRKVIGLSRHLMALFDRDEVIDTVLHEVAHALVGPRHGHDEVWKATARTIGASATRCVSEHARSARRVDGHVPEGPPRHAPPASAAGRIVRPLLARVRSRGAHHVASRRQGRADERSLRGRAARAAAPAHRRRRRVATARPARRAVGSRPAEARHRRLNACLRR
ncbi:MAG: SprT-like domain-containing protein [Ilumatobacteraceae bacterium]